MQTFLPYQDFESCAKVLDYRRLGKQRVEVKQILMVLCGKSTGWQNHPTVLMWRGFEPALIYYGVCMIQEWIDRGYKNTIDLSEFGAVGKYFKRPLFIGSPDFHLSHQSNLVRKFPEHYRQYFPSVPDNLPYVWPVTKTS